MQVAYRTTAVHLDGCSPNLQSEVVRPHPVVRGAIQRLVSPIYFEGESTPSGYG